MGRRLDPVWFEILRSIRVKSKTVSTLAKFLGVSRVNVWRNVKLLEKAGLVKTRTVSRVVLVEMSKKRK